jgi:outer membrane protein
MNFSKLIVPVVLIFLTVAVVVLFVLQFDSGNKYVYVDSVKLVNGYEAMKDARKDYEQKVAAWKANLDTLRGEAETKIKEYNATAGKLSAREKQLMEELVQSKQEQFMNYQQVVTEKVRKEDEELSSKVLSKVNDFVKRYGQQKGYVIVMAATQYGNIVYADPRADITEEVLAGLNAEYRQ